MYRILQFDERICAIYSAREEVSLYTLDYAQYSSYDYSCIAIMCLCVWESDTRHFIGSECEWSSDDSVQFSSSMHIAERAKITPNMNKLVAGHGFNNTMQLVTLRTRRKGFITMQTFCPYKPTNSFKYTRNVVNLQ